MCQLMLPSSAHSEENITFFRKSKAFTGLARKSMSYCSYIAVEGLDFMQEGRVWTWTSPDTLSCSGEVAL